MNQVQVGSFWSLRGTHGEFAVEVTDVVDGVNPVVIYDINDEFEERSTGMSTEANFVQAYEAMWPDWNAI